MVDMLQRAEEGLLDLADSINISNIIKGNDSNPFESDPFTDNWELDDEIKKKASLDTSSCKQILFEGITSNSTVRAWDIIILIPNMCFLAFLILRLKKSREKLSSVNTPVLTALYGLVLICSFASVGRCLMSIMISLVSQAQIEEKADKSLWLVLRMILFTTEVCVMAFGILSGQLVEAKASVKRIVFISLIGSLAFSIIQACMEMQTVRSDSPEHLAFYYQTSKMSRAMHLFSHGGVVFWMVSSATFALVYATALALPILPCKRWLTPPNKKSFYHYIVFQLLINIVQAVGCAMIYAHSSPGKSTGMCFLNLTTFFYVVAFIPIVYVTFLSQFLGSKSVQPTLLFSYKAQVNDGDCEELGIKLGDNESASHFSLSSPTIDDTRDSLNLEQSNPIIITFQKKGST